MNEWNPFPQIEGSTFKSNTVLTTSTSLSITDSDLSSIDNLHVNIDHSSQSWALHDIMAQFESGQKIETAWNKSIMSEN